MSEANTNGGGLPTESVVMRLMDGAVPSNPDRYADEQKEPQRITWTSHAIERVGQRFGFRADIKIPNRVILRACREVEEGQKFRIRRGEVVYACKREGDAAVILTVFFANRYRSLKDNDTESA